MFNVCRQPGLREEFWPPCCAEAALSAAVDCARRCAWLDDASERAAFAAATVQVRQGLLKPPQQFSFVV